MAYFWASASSSSLPRCCSWRCCSIRLEQRAPEIGTLLALGFTRAGAQTLLREGVTLAFFGGVFGCDWGSMFYARGMLHGLTTIWRDAVGSNGSDFSRHGRSRWSSASFASVTVSTITIWLALRKFVKRHHGNCWSEKFIRLSPKSKVSNPKLIGMIALGAWSGDGWLATLKGDTQNAGIFFGAGVGADRGD